MDDTIFVDTSEQKINKEIKLLGIKQRNEEQPLEFREEGKVTAFLRIKVNECNNRKFYLSQPSLILKVLWAIGMAESNPNCAPHALEPLGPDMDGKI